MGILRIQSMPLDHKLGRWENQRLLKLARPTENHHAAGANQQNSRDSSTSCCIRIRGWRGWGVIGSDQSCLLGRCLMGFRSVQVRPGYSGDEEAIVGC